jgi:hypothetical protein
MFTVVGESPSTWVHAKQRSRQRGSKARTAAPCEPFTTERWGFRLS